MSFSVKDIPQFSRGDFLHAAHLEAMREQLIRTLQLTKGFDDQTSSVAKLNRIAKAKYFKVSNTGADIPAYSIFGISDGSALSFNWKYSVEVDIASTKTDWLLSNDKYVIPSGQSGNGLPINDFQPVLLRYTGSVPTINDRCGITSGAVDKDSTEKVVVAVSEPDTANNRIWCTRLGAASSTTIRVFEFNTAATFETTDDTVAVDVTVADVWLGEAPAGLPTQINVWNSGNIFFGPTFPLWGLALYSDTRDRYQIIQLECIKGSDQAAIFSEADGDTITYDGVEATVPFGDWTDGSFGDLLTLETNGELTFNRAPRSSLLIDIFAVIMDITGVTTDGDKSIFTMEFNNDGAGFVDLGTAVIIQHPHWKSGGIDYGMGGTTTGFWEISAITFDTGDKLRVRVSTANDATVTEASFKQCRFGITETGK